MNINTKTFVDVHTTGKRMEFGSLKAYDKFLKDHKAYVVSQKDFKNLQEPKQVKSDYKKVVENAWKEREKFKMDVKYGRKKLEYDRQ